MEAEILSSLLEVGKQVEGRKRSLALHLHECGLMKRGLLSCPSAAGGGEAPNGPQ